MFSYQECLARRHGALRPVAMQGCVFTVHEGMPTVCMRGTSPSRCACQSSNVATPVQTPMPMSPNCKTSIHLPSAEDSLPPPPLSLLASARSTASSWIASSTTFVPPWSSCAVAITSTLGWHVGRKAPSTMATNSASATFSDRRCDQPSSSMLDRYWSSDTWTCECASDAAVQRVVAGT